MKSKGETMVEKIQSKLPHVNVFWDPPPDDLFQHKPCKLFAVNRNNPKKNGSIYYRNGISSQPVDTLVKDFVEHIGPDVTD